MNLQDQQAAKEALEAAKSSLENAFANSAENVKPDKGAIVIQKARTEIINNNFETEQKEYKEKIMKLPSLIYDNAKRSGKFGRFKIKSTNGSIGIGSVNNRIYSTPINLNLQFTEEKNGCLIDIFRSRGFVDFVINEEPKVLFREFSFESNEVIQEAEFYFKGDRSLKNAYNRIKMILKRDFEIEIDNLKSKSDLIETSPASLIENQETQCREKYKQIQNICKILERKAKAGEFGEVKNSEFTKYMGQYYKVGNCEIQVPEDLNSQFTKMRIASRNKLFYINPNMEFNNLRISKINGNISNWSTEFETYTIMRKPRDYIQPTLEQLSLFYNELTQLLQENNIEL